MKYRALTIAREFGSGGAEIASAVATSLGWRLVDKDLLTEIGNRAKVPVADAAVMDERVDPWLHRLTRPLWGNGSDGISAIAPVDVFDADAAADLSKQVILEAYSLGDCVIVGRGAQCVLQGKPDVFHVFVYAPWEDRLQRIRPRVPADTNLNELLRSMDAQRLEYVRRHFGENRLDPHLYDMMINARDRSGAAARVVLAAMTGA